MRISDWSSDVCSSDLTQNMGNRKTPVPRGFLFDLTMLIGRSERLLVPSSKCPHVGGVSTTGTEIGSAACREGVCQSVYIKLVAVTLNKKCVKTRTLRKHVNKYT